MLSRCGNVATLCGLRGLVVRSTFTNLKLFSGAAYPQLVAAAMFPRNAVISCLYFCATLMIGLNSASHGECPWKLPPSRESSGVRSL